MRTREEWKTTIDEIAGLKDKFMKIKDDSESLFMEAKRIALESLDEVKQFAGMAKLNMGTVVGTFMGEENQDEMNSAPASEVEDSASEETFQKPKVTKAKSKSTNSQNLL